MSGKKRVFVLIVIAIMIVTLIAFKLRQLTRNRHLGSTINISNQGENVNV